MNYERVSESEKLLSIQKERELHCNMKKQRARGREADIEKTFRQLKE